MLNIQSAASIVFLIFGLLAFVDGVYLHLWKYRLFAWQVSRYEHFLHSLRALLFPTIAFLLFAIQAGGWLLWAGAGLGLADLIIQALDLREEEPARKAFGGLSTMEYSLHVWLTGLHGAGLALTLISRPLVAWSWESAAFLPISSPLAVNIAWLLIPGAIGMGVVHLILLHPFFRKADSPTSEFQERNLVAIN